MNGPKADYSPIPNAEEGLLTTAPSSERNYPRVNDAERKFLLALDDAIDDCGLEIVLPRLDVAATREIRTKEEFFRSLRYPTVVLVIEIVSAVVVAPFWSDPSAAVLFPYVSCVAMFLSSVPATVGRLTRRAERVLAVVEQSGREAEERAGRLFAEAFERMDRAEDAMRDALSPIRGRLRRAAELKPAIRLVDPDADVPDEDEADGVEARFGELRDELRGAATAAEAGVAADAVLSGVPWGCVLLPLLVAVLLLELLLTYFISRPSFTAVAESGGGFVLQDNETVDAVVDRANVTAVMGEAGVVDNHATTSVVGYEGGPVYYAIQTYFLVVNQLGITFAVTGPKTTASSVNCIVISRIESHVNRDIDEKAGTAYRSVFWRGLTEVQEMALDLFSRMEKLKGPLREAERRGGDAEGGLIV